MSTSEASSMQTEQGRREMRGRNREPGRRWSAIGWGLFLVLAGGLVLAESRGLLRDGEPWLYLAIGIGAIFIIGFLAQFFGNHPNRWAAFGSLIAGVSLIYVGAAFLGGFGDWWPMALVFAGICYVARETWSRDHHATGGNDAS
jgi:peptidoglycan/LPS O-acetylase OafA/YrhL